ncbi:MAG: DUF4126 domain-containing protein [Bryobacterales bacterium]|nr:DUF4126 domain-containing protein [Bryobacterales bacterium]
MKSVEALSALLGIAVVSGVNLYAAILTLGLGLRFGLLTGLPPELAVVGHPAVLIAAGIFYAAEFVADKIPFFSPLWDGVHTFIRPVGAAMLALGATAQWSPLAQVAAVLGAGTVALGTHSTKMGVRLLAHAAPEPGTQSLLSLAEDFGVVALLLFAYRYPHIALPVLAALILIMLWMLPVLGRTLRFIVACFIGRILSFGFPAGNADIPVWITEAAPQANAVRLFTRKGPLPRLVSGYLVDNEFFAKRWFRVRRYPMEGIDKATLCRGLFTEVLLLPNGSSFYLTKEWRNCWELRRSPSKEGNLVVPERIPLQDSAEMS